MSLPHLDVSSRKATALSVVRELIRLTIHAGVFKKKDVRRYDRQLPGMASFFSARL
jgi:hypothetical protein